MKKLIYITALITLCLASLPIKAQMQTYTVTNNTGMVVKSVSLSPNDANKWGLGLELTGNIDEGKSFEFTQSFTNDNCIQDVRYLGIDGEYYYIQDVNMCLTTAIILKKPVIDMKDKNLNNSDTDDSDKDRRTDKEILDDKVQTDKEKMQDDQIQKK